MGISARASEATRAHHAQWLQMRPQMHSAGARPRLAASTAEQTSRLDEHARSTALTEAMPCQRSRGATSAGGSWGRPSRRSRVRSVLWSGLSPPATSVTRHRSAHRSHAPPPNRALQAQPRPRRQTIASSVHVQPCRSSRWSGGADAYTAQLKLAAAMAAFTQLGVRPRRNPRLPPGLCCRWNAPLPRRAWARGTAQA